MGKETGRRNFLIGAMAAGSAWTLANSSGPAGQQPPSPPEGARRPPAEIRPAPLETVRLGLVGAGDRGTYLLYLLLGMEGVHVRAVCDVVEGKVARAQRLAEERHLPKPEAYVRGDADYLRLCQRDDLDLVVNATPWPLHTPVCLAALQAGKHVATEVPAALSVEDCWRQVEAAEQANKHCMLLENYCYQRDVLMIGNLIRKGFFGEIMHAEGGYQKDGRDADLKLNPDGSLGWQGQIRKNCRGNTFPTHDIGPLAQWMDIHRGDRFDYLVSLGGNARAFNEYGAQYFSPSHPLATTHLDMSDINVCLIRTVQGRTISLLSDTLLSRPQPASLYRLMGSKGAYDRTTDKLYIEGKSPRRDRWHGQWEAVTKYYEEFDHPMWRDLRVRALASGQRAGDYLCLYRLVKALRNGSRPDIDVYDAAAWSSIVELSERSARHRSQAVDFPDFTRGRWKTTPPTATTGA
jgi:predicted dehydrogenase